jgi:hypothetical protein
MDPTMTLSVTLDDVLSWEPCYSEDRLRELAAGRERITALEALDLPVPAKDRLWLVLREEFVPGPVLHEFACRCAESALALVESRGAIIDPRSREAIRVKRAWLRGGATREELAAAGDAAGDAARAAAWDAQVEILRRLLAEAN